MHPSNHLIDDVVSEEAGTGFYVLKGLGRAKLTPWPVKIK